MRVRPVLPPDRDPGRYAPGRGSRTRHGAALAGSLLLNLLLLAGVVAAMRGPDFLPSGNHPALVSISITPKPQKTAPPPPPSKAPPVDKPSLAPTRPAPEKNPAPLPIAPHGSPPVSKPSMVLPEPKPALVPPTPLPVAAPSPHRPEPTADRLDALSQRLAEGLTRAAEEAEVPLAVSRSASTVTPFFLDTAPSNWDQAKLADTKTFARFHGAMLQRGVHLAPSQFEAWFVSTAHDEALIDRTIEAAAESLRLARHA